MENRLAHTMCLPGMHRVFGKRVLHHAGLGIGAIEIDPELPGQERPEQAMAVPDRADSEACMMEHALSEDTMQRWLKYLESQGIMVGDD